jgi:hypothetical protein
MNAGPPSGTPNEPIAVSLSISVSIDARLTGPGAALIILSRSGSSSSTPSLALTSARIRAMFCPDSRPVIRPDRSRAPWNSAVRTYRST